MERRSDIEKLYQFLNKKTESKKIIEAEINWIISLIKSENESLSAIVDEMKTLDKNI